MIKEKNTPEKSNGSGAYFGRLFRSLVIVCLSEAQGTCSQDEHDFDKIMLILESAYIAVHLKLLLWGILQRLTLETIPE